MVMAEGGRVSGVILTQEGRWAGCPGKGWGGSRSVTASKSGEFPGRGAGKVRLQTGGTVDRLQKGPEREGKTGVHCNTYTRQHVFLSTTPNTNRHFI